jgi:transposase-like protein
MQNKNLSPTSITNYGKNYHNPTCPQCGSANLSTGAGRKPGEMSLRCSECKAFIGYRDIGKLRRLQRLRRQKQTTDCLNFIEKHAGLSSDEAIFVLTAAANESTHL